MKVRVSAIKKGDRFFNEFWQKDVVATTDAYRLDGTMDPEQYSTRKAKPKVAIMSQDERGEWQHCWWMIEVGVHGIDGGAGGWSKPEYHYIEVEREVSA